MATEPLQPVRSMSVLMPAYNERATLQRAVERIMACPPPRGLSREIVIVDDGSTDGTRAVLEELGRAHAAVRGLAHARNRGKGAALRAALAAAAGDVVVIHDADLEYDPRDHAALLEPILDGRADAVIGSRFLGQTHRVLYYWHALANGAVTHASNMFTNLNLTDVECCLKAMRREVFARIVIEEDRFGVEPELVAKIARLRLGARRARVYEVPVNYDGRTYAEGKKITWRDGAWALWAIVKYGLSEHPLPAKPTSAPPAGPQAAEAAGSP